MRQLTEIGTCGKSQLTWVLVGLLYATYSAEDGHL